MAQLEVLQDNFLALDLCINIETWSPSHSILLNQSSWLGKETTGKRESNGGCWALLFTIQLPTKWWPCFLNGLHFHSQTKYTKIHSYMKVVFTWFLWESEQHSQLPCWKHHENIFFFKYSDSDFKSYQKTNFIYCNICHIT